MKVSVPPDALKKELVTIGDSMTADWLKSAGADGQAIIATYRKK